jgi:hypothetical protein
MAGMDAGMLDIDGQRTTGNDVRQQNGTNGLILSRPRPRKLPTLEAFSRVLLPFL